MFLSNTNFVPEGFKFILDLNPLAHIIDGYHCIFYYQTLPNFSNLFWMFILSIITLGIGYKIFDRLQKGFAEEL